MPMNFLANTRHMRLEDVLALRVDRDHEITACVQHLLERGQNAYVWGIRGVGKTFIVRLVEAELQRFQEFLTVNVDVLGLPGFGRTNPAAAFPEAVLLSLCQAIWKNVLGKPYSQLRSRLDLREGDIRIPCKLTRCVETIYTQVMAAQRKSKYEYFNSVGFSAGAKGEKRETGSVEQAQPPILPFEFFEYCEELLEALSERGKTRVVALCDEANLLPLHQQREILSTYLDLFASRRVQFLFVAGVLFGEAAKPPVPDGFDLVLEVPGLADADAVKLLNKVAQSFGCELDPTASKAVAERCAGNPRVLLDVLLQARHESRERGHGLGASILDAACTRVLEGIARRGFEFETPGKEGHNKGMQPAPKKPSAADA